jgi:transcriptional regulator GlxA family with amidase domain
MSSSQLRLGQSANDSQAPEPAADDPHVARAITAMKAEPSRRWTVAALARIGGLSRAAFARRFTRTIGMGPRAWLTEHRLRIAQTRLVATDDGLAAIADEVGYACEFAFAKAFKRLFGVAPGLFRRLSRADRIPSASPSFRAAA